MYDMRNNEKNNEILGFNCHKHDAHSKILNGPKNRLHFIFSSF